MKTRNLPFLSKMLIAVSIFVFISNTGIAQTEPVTTASPDTTVSKKETDEGRKDKKDKKRKDEFIIYVGANFNQLSVSSDTYESAIQAGYHIGFDYKRGKFFYWQVGLRFNSPMYKLTTVSSGEIPVVESKFSIKDIDIPVTGGINFLSATNRVLALRLFISAVPAFNLGVGDNDLGITKDNINSFVMYGQAGLGINVAFVVLEFGYNYGFNDILQNDQSKPGQLFINLGFRF